MVACFQYEIQSYSMFRKALMTCRNIVRMKRLVFLCKEQQKFGWVQFQQSGIEFVLLALDLCLDSIPLLLILDRQMLR